MNNNEFENKLSREIKNFNKVPDSVDKKIQNAFKEIDSRKTKKVKTTFRWNKLVSMAASITTLAFLAGNGVAYAVGAPNIYSWVLNKVGIQKEYEEVKQEVNQTVESNGVKITLLDCGYDTDWFMAGYKVEGINYVKGDNITILADYIFYTEENNKIVNVKITAVDTDMIKGEII